MNSRQASLRSNNRPPGSTSKRPVPDHSDLPKKSGSGKKLKTSAHVQAVHAQKTDAFPRIKLLRSVCELSSYQQALCSKNSSKAELRDLDQSLSNAPLSKSKDQQPSDLKERLLRVLRWKLLRGKYRATLPALVSQNSQEDVERVVKKALDQLGACKTVDEALQSGALATMCDLRGIGPATAAGKPHSSSSMPIISCNKKKNNTGADTRSSDSCHLFLCLPAFLSFEAPNLIPVFSDEAASFFGNSLGPIKYTLPYYKKFAECMKLKLEEFVQLDDIWDMRRLERALWTHRICQNYIDGCVSDYNELMGDSVVQPEPSTTAADVSSGESEES
ncbi:hypothetical protein KEM48_003038 [Puccinia striiformis f. sp. tritici PST-130]|nr:hypothetical protein H4Q26_002961 [Puccinia striiformis f. sp. tritici PST-130]KAI9609118.1 hypothetical protein KEM48_003038 [Puccinia striiformis f. sp. tritici PST-130]